jgi:hypothetical protein
MNQPIARGSFAAFRVDAPPLLVAYEEPDEY